MGARGPIPAAGDEVCHRPEPPKDLSGQGLKIWRRVVDSLDLHGGDIISAPDAKLLEKLVELEIQWEYNKQALAESGQLYRDPSGRVAKSPRLVIMQELGDQLLNVYRELGMTPVSRRRFGMSGKSKPKGKLSIMMARKNGTDGVESSEV